MGSLPTQWKRVRVVVPERYVPEVPGEPGCHDATVLQRQGVMGATQKLQRARAQNARGRGLCALVLKPPKFHTMTCVFTLL